METTKEQVVAAFDVVVAVSEAIRAVGSVPSGVLYANLVGVVTLSQYQQVIALLKRADLVTEKGHLLTWSGPSI